jgi:hypothetical protein
VVPSCMNSTISTPFLCQKPVAISFLADVYLNCLACLVNVCASSAFEPCLRLYGSGRSHVMHTNSKPWIFSRLL